MVRQIDSGMKQIIGFGDWSMSGGNYQLSSRGDNSLVASVCVCQGSFVVHRLGLATVILYTKHEVSTFTHYKDMKGDEKCKNWNVLGLRGHPKSLETSPFDRAHMTFYSTLIETMRLSCTNFEL